MNLRALRQRIAMLIAPWLEPPRALAGCDLRSAGPCVETAAVVGLQTWVRECLAAGYCVADVVTGTYTGIDGTVCQVSIRRDDPGVFARGRR